MKRLTAIALLTTALLHTACTGLFDGIYDEAPAPDPHQTQVDSTVVSGQLYIDATSWTDWYFVDLDTVLRAARRGDSSLSPVVTAMAIPTEAVADDGSGTGIYTYWYDVWGKGISVNEQRSFYPTAQQPEPPTWTFAVHRNNVRTNGGAACETQFTDLSQLDGLTDDELAGLTFTPDAWTQNVVWAIQAQMLNSLIGSQGIAVNPVLSSWLRLDIPPMPPAFTHNNHVFLLRLADGTYAALQLADYIGPTGAKCCLTINYRYPV